MLAAGLSPPSLSQHVTREHGRYTYVNRKNFHSITVQAVCDFNMIFEDIVAKWRGSHHDSFISFSTFCSRFTSREYGTGWLLGDSDYGLKQWFITPIATPTTAE